MTDMTLFEPILKRYLIASAVGLALIGLILLLSPYVLPESDKWALFRYFVLRGPATIWGLIILAGGVLFFDFATPGDMIHSIEKEANVASAITMSALIIGISLILCYA